MKIKLLSSALAALLASAALADVTISFDGPQNLVGASEFFVTSPQVSGTITGVIFHYNFTNPNGTASYSSDMACVVETEQFGYFNRLLTGATVNHGVSPGATGTTAAQDYTSPVMNLTTPIVCTNSTVNVGYGNAWTGGGCTMSDVTVTLVGVVPGSGPYPPSVTAGASTPGGGSAGNPRLLTVAVTPGGNPASAITTVSGDLTSVGGPAVANFHNDGLNGDVSAADNIYSYQLASVSAAGTVSITATDAAARSGSGNINVNVFDVTDVGEITGLPGGVERVTTSEVNVASGGQVTWLMFHISAPVLGSDIYYLDIDTETTAGIDTELGLYSNDGSLIANDDDSGSGLLSQLTFGATAAPRPAMGDLPYNGRNGNLPVGTYFLAVGVYNVTFAGNFTATSTGTTLGNIEVNFRSNLPADTTTPSNPFVGGGASSPSPAVAGQPVVLSVHVVGGHVPDSTGLVVTGDLTGFGGSATAAFNDLGTGGDAIAGDGIWSATGTTPASAIDNGVIDVVFNAHDAQARNAAPYTLHVTTFTSAWDEMTNGTTDAGDTIATAQIPAGTGPLNAITGSTTVGSDNADMYKINICDTANFTANTNLVAGDTQLFLFDSAGLPVVSNDDTIGLSAQLTNALVTASGEYYLAISRFNSDPSDANGALLWANGSGGQAAPTNPSPAATWGAGVTGPYRISLTGVCFAGPGACSTADIGVQGGVPGQDRLLDNNDFIVFIANFFSQLPSADIGVQGGVAGHDTAWDNNDFIVYIGLFFTDFPNCTGNP